MPPEASVVIVTHDGMPYLEACLSSVCQEAGQDAEVIVVDNASTDGGPDWVADRYPGVVLVRNAANVGFAAACNQGARAAAGQALVFLNQDTAVEPGWLAGLVAPLADETGVVLTTSKAVLMSRPERVHLCGQDVHYAGLAFGRGFLTPAADLSDTARVGAVSGCSFAIRRELWRALGGLDESLFMYYEETDLSWRAQLAGHACACVPASVVRHDYRPGRPGPFRLYHAARNRQIVVAKNWRWGTLLLLAPALALAGLLEWAQALAGGWPGLRAKARADLWVLTHLGQIVRLHAMTQRLRQMSDAQILAERTWRIEVREMEIGALGRIAIVLCNAFFGVHYALARCCCAALGL